MPRHDTTYMETELLLAVMEERIDDAEKIAGQMLEGEQSKLLYHLAGATEILMSTPPANIDEL